MAVPLAAAPAPLEVPFSKPLLAEVPITNSYPLSYNYFSGYLSSGVLYYPDVASFAWFVTWRDFRGMSGLFLYRARNVPRGALV